MSGKEVSTQSQNQMAKIEQVLIRGDLSVLTEPERIGYYKQVCETVGLNPLTKPFDYITLNGKLVLYANKGCAEQLRQIHNISIRITDRKVIEGVYVVTAQASRPDGRVDESTGAVTVMNLKGDVLANAYLKCETKAKRRVTLSICGLNVLDETEVDSIPEAKRPENPIVMHQPLAGDGTALVDAPFRYARMWPKRGHAEVEREIGLEGMRERVLTLEAKFEAAKKDGKRATNQDEWDSDIEECARYIASRENAEITFESFEAEKVR